MGDAHRRLRALTGRWALVALVAAPLLLAGCSGSESSDAAATTPVPSPGAGPWDERERAVYREAVTRLEDYEARNQRILAAGKATRAAKVFYQNRLRDWETSYAQLQEYEREGIRTARAPVVLSTEPASIMAFQDGAAHIVVSRCTDHSDLGATRRGEPLPAEHEQPVVQRVEVRRYENLSWRIGTFETTDEPCDG